MGSVLVQLSKDGYEVEPKKWQGIDAPTGMVELINVHVAGDMPGPENVIKVCQPNIPWAEAHFLERVSGVPMNPGNEYRNWPYYRGNVPKHQTEQGEKFSHSYMERYWPRFAGDRDRPGAHPLRGVRYEYGDLRDVVNLIVDDPSTRQAYLPVWFPEDTGAVHGGRVPCSLGYWWVIRHNRLYCSYYIRSCDAIRHFRDDVFLTVKLTHWLYDELCKADERFKGIQMGELNMYIGSLHVWQPERGVIGRIGERLLNEDPTT